MPKSNWTIQATDYASLQAACDAAPARVTVQLPLGVTTLTSTLLIKQQAFTLRGAGHQRT